MFLETLQRLFGYFNILYNFFDVNRNKVKPLKYTTEEGRKILKGADVIIVDGDCIVPKEVHQIVLHIVAALPGDEVLNSNSIFVFKESCYQFRNYDPEFLP